MEQIASRNSYTMVSFSLFYHVVPFLEIEDYFIILVVLCTFSNIPIQILIPTVS